MREKTDSILLNVIQLVNQESSRGTLDLEMIKPYLNDFIRARFVPKGGYITTEVPFMNFVPLNMVRQISCPERRRRSSWALTGQ